MSLVRVAPGSKEHVRLRRERNLAELSCPGWLPGDRFGPALEWLRLAAVYADRRRYMDERVRETALARREVIRADAARIIQGMADEVAGLVPELFRPSGNREKIRTAYLRAETPKATLDLARALLMHASSRARRYAVRDGGAAAAQTAVIKDMAVWRLIDWAKELDADDYGE